MFRLLLATRNRHKASEIGGLLAGLPVAVADLGDFPGVPEVEEDGQTLEDNAAKKAVSACRASGLWSLGDDTGLEVEPLGGAPGVRSARYAGEACDYEANNRKLLRELRRFSSRDRRAVFRCVMALASPQGRVVLEEGKIEGLIIDEPRGANGFGYDPVFLLPLRGKTLAELTLEEKNRISHRSLALGGMRGHIESAARGAASTGPGRPDRKVSSCVRCGLEMEDWHCRRLCPGCGFQMDCSDPF